MNPWRRNRRPDDSLDMNHIPARLDEVRRRIRSAALAAGRDPDAITLLAVSKTRPVDDIRAAYAAGQRLFGENYLQEALPKIAALADLDLEARRLVVGDAAQPAADERAVGLRHAAILERIP